MNTHRIYLNPLAQEFLFGYIEGVDWITDYTDDNNNLLTKQQQNEFYARVMNWINTYKKLNNKKYSDIKINDNEIFNFIQCQAFAQADLIRNEVLKVSNDSASLFEEYKLSNFPKYFLILHISPSCSTFLKNISIYLVLLGYSFNKGIFSFPTIFL